MTLTKLEVSVAWQALHTTGVLNQQDQQPTARNFPLSQLKDAANLSASLRANCVDDKEAFKDGEVDFTTDEKKLLKDCLKRDWSASVGTSVLSLQEKLS